MISGRTGGISVLLVLALGLGASGASAATRHASPGASGPDPCVAAAPCSFFTAVSGAVNGDEVLVTPGEYTDTAGDLGPPSQNLTQIQLGVTVRGEAGKPRPKIVLEEGKWLSGAFSVNSEDLVAHLEITTGVATVNIVQFGGTVEDLIVRNAASSAIACSLTRGTMRDTACLSSGADGAALGARISGAGTVLATLRNVTAIATGAGGVGISYVMSGGGTITVDAKSVIAEGAKSVVAEGLSTSGNPGTGGHVAVNLDHSVFKETETSTDAGEGSATIVGTNSSSAVPLLAADGYHQLKGSPTIDQGALDVSSGSADLDGQERTIGPSVDIGADEFANQTSLSLICNPPQVVLTDALPGPGTDCTATITDGEAGVLPLSGTVSFSSTGNGDFTAQSCTLTQPGLSDHATCGVNYKPRIGSAGAHTVTAVYAGNANHDGSQGSTGVTVTEAPLVCPAAGPGSCGGPPPRPPGVRIGKKPAKRTAKRSARFTFSSDQSSASFECKLDKGRFKSCRSPFKRRVKPGHHTFKVRALGAGGASAPAAYGWLVLAPKAR